MATVNDGRNTYVVLSIKHRVGSNKKVRDLKNLIEYERFKPKRLRRHQRVVVSGNVPEIKVSECCGVERLKQGLQIQT